MFLSSLTLLVALALSAIAAFYSIAGLAAIFSAAATPIIIMGSTLELAKITVTIWLHEYWRRCRWLMKVYLVIAVAVLMMITSMGIYGYLSKAHLDQTVPTGDVAAQVSLLDEKIKTERDNIEAFKQALKQLDAQVNEMMGRTTDDKGANRAVQIRRQQAAERKQLQNSIAEAQQLITQLQEERAPMASNLRKVEAEVGPIKYIAALIYDQKPDEDMLERAVRWVIISIVFVFDPLAIMMLLAATESFGWRRQERAKVKEPEVQEEKPHNVEPPKTAETSIEPVIAKPITTPVEAVHEFPVIDPPATEEPQTVNDPKVEPVVEDESIEKAAERTWKANNPEGSLKRERELFAQGKTKQLPWNDLALKLDPDLNSPGEMLGFGTAWPKNPKKGDQFVRTDRMPTALFKFNGRDWIEVNKKLTDEYVYNDEYIIHLIDKIASGEYDPDLLTDAEEELIAARLGASAQNKQ